MVRPRIAAGAGALTITGGIGGVSNDSLTLNHTAQAASGAKIVVSGLNGGTDVTFSDVTKIAIDTGGDRVRFASQITVLTRVDGGTGTDSILGPDSAIV